MIEFDPTRHSIPDDDVEVESSEPLRTSDEEAPPAPTFLIVPNRYGPGTTGVYLADGTPVGIWLSMAYGDLTPTQVRELLEELELEPKLAASFMAQRELRDSTAMEIVDNPALVEFSKSEE